MATLAATMFYEQMSSHLQALRQRGKPFTVAMVACMRKLLCVHPSDRSLRGDLEEGSLWGGGDR
jgi:hypothetical protein